MEFFKKYSGPLSILLGFFLGASLSSGLLIYSGKELVNLFVWLFFLVVFPFFISLLLFIYYLFVRRYEGFIKKSFLSGVFFSLGGLLALIFIITTRDIAFGWATTVDISSQTLYKVLSNLSIWKSFCSDCVPNLSLVEVSRYTRLGGGVTKEQIENSLELGEWWKFLAMSIFVYGVLFRSVLYFLVGLKKRKKVEFVSGSEEEKFEELEVQKDVKDITLLKGIDFTLVGYGVEKGELENLELNPKEIVVIGGSSSFLEDEKRLESIKNDIVFVVKSWEPPVLDFIDLIDIVRDKKVYIYLLGLKEKVKKSDEDIWLKKLQEFGFDSVEVIV